MWFGVYFAYFDFVVLYLFYDFIAGAKTFMFFFVLCMSDVFVFVFVFGEKNGVNLMCVFVVVMNLWNCGVYVLFCVCVVVSFERY